MGLLKRLATLPLQETFASGPKPRGNQPDWPAEIFKVKLHPADTATIWVRFFTGDETPWQGPGEASIRTLHPEGRPPVVGQRVLIQVSDMNGAQPYVHWDKPAPELPPMTFPSNVDPSDPLTAIGQLQQMVEMKTLQPEDFERTKKYLLDGGWGPPPSP